jgi:hypothetical protein
MAFAADSRIQRVHVDLARREVSAVYDGDPDLLDLLGPLNAGARVIDTRST